jgi:predicted alpha/beta-hydrolase family hydrolase
VLGQVAGGRGPVPTVLWERPPETPADELAIVLPGAWFGCQSPPTDRATLALRAAGADVFWVNYSYDREPAYGEASSAERQAWTLADARAGVEAALARRPYARHVVVGKSLGTMSMARLAAEGRLPDAARTIWLTPVLRDEAVLSCLEGLTHPGLLVIGDADPYHDAKFVRRLAGTGRCDVLVLEGADHGLNAGTDVAATAAITARYLARLAEWLAGG